MRRTHLAILLMSFCAITRAQTSPADEALLAKTRALYDTPFRRGLINFDCAVGFDFEQHIKDNFAAPPPSAAPIAKLLQPIHYRVFVDQAGAVVSAQSKLPDLSGVPNADVIEDSNRQLLQAGLGTWIPSAAGIVLPVGPTQFHFDKTAGSEGYKLSMAGNGLSVVLTLDDKLHLISGTVEKPQEIELTTDFVPGPNGLVLASGPTNTNHAGVASYRYTYQLIDGFQIPASVAVTSEQKMTWHYSLTDCKTQHGQVVHVRPSQP